jgi:hypothetical protein
MAAAVAKPADGCPLGPGCDCRLHGYIVSVRRSPQSASEGYWVDAVTPASAERQALTMSGVSSEHILDMRLFS